MVVLKLSLLEVIDSVMIWVVGVVVGLGVGLGDGVGVVGVGVGEEFLLLLL